MNLHTPRRFRFLASTAAALFLVALPALASIEREFTVSPGDTLKITAEGASIDIHTGSSSRATIEIRRGSDSEDRIRDDYDVDVRQDGDRVIVEVERRGFTNRWFGGWRKGLEIDVEIPRRFDVELRTSGGSIEIADLDGDVQANTSGGSLRFDAIAGEVSATTSGGSITIEECSGNANVSTSGGSIRINEVRGAINASTSGGSVKAYISEQPAADSKLTTSGGSVTVYLDDGLGVDLDARTSGGRVRTDFDFTVEGSDSYSKQRIAGTLNGGGPELRLRTSGGSIQVLRR